MSILDTLNLKINTETVDVKTLLTFITGVENRLSNMNYDFGLTDIQLISYILEEIIIRFGGKRIFTEWTSFKFQVSEDDIKNETCLNFMLQPMASNSFLINLKLPSGKTVKFELLIDINSYVFEIPGEYILKIKTYNSPSDISYGKNEILKYLTNNVPGLDLYPNLYVLNPISSEIYDNKFSYCDANLNIRELFDKDGHEISGKYNNVDINFIKLPENIVNIKNYFMSDNLTIENIYFPYTCNISSIGAYAFENCKSLKKLIIPDGVLWIGDFAFKFCQNLKYISFPSSLTSIGEMAFGYINGTCKVFSRDPDIKYLNFQTYKETLLKKYPVKYDEPYTKEMNEYYFLLSESQKDEVLKHLLEIDKLEVYY